MTLVIKIKGVRGTSSQGQWSCSQTFGEVRTARFGISVLESNFLSTCNGDLCSSSDSGAIFVAYDFPFDDSRAKNAERGVDFQLGQVSLTPLVADVSIHNHVTDTSLGTEQ